MDFLSKAFQKMTGGLKEVKDVSDQPQDEVDLVAHIVGKIQDVRSSGSRVAQEGIWMTNYAYLMGYDSVYYDSAARQFRSTGMGTRTINRNRLFINKILPTCQRRQARLTKNPPKWEIRPDNSTENSKTQARFEKNLLEYYFDKELVLEKRQEMMMGLMQCGHYYMGPCWNDEKGEFLTKQKEQQEQLEGMENVLSNEAKAELEYEFEGDVEVEIISPFEIFVDPLATNLKEAKWAIRAKVRKIDYFRERFPDRGHLVKEEGAWLLSAQYEMRIQSMTGQGPAQTGIENQMKHAAIEVIYWERPSKKYSKGRQVICANGVLLEDKELPIEEIPLAKFDDVTITGKFYPEALVTHMRPIQDQYNRVLTKRAEWTNRLLAGKYMAARGSELMQEAMNDQSGEIVYFTPVANAPNAGAPTAMDIPVMPSYAYEEEVRLNEAFYDIAGEGEISRGILPAAGIPAIGMQLLLEQDETRVGTVTAQHEYALAHLGKMVLMYLEKYVTNERLVKISDPNSQYIIEKWTGADLKSKHDVIVIRGSTAPQSLAVRRNEILNLWQQGLLGDPVDPQIRQSVLQRLEYGDVNGVWQDQSIDMAQIKKTMEIIELGKVPEVNELDNHALHIQEKNRFRKTDGFDQMDADKQAVLVADIEAHLRELMKITAPQFGMNPNAENDTAAAVDTIAGAGDDVIQTDLADIEAKQELEGANV